MNRDDVDIIARERVFDGYSKLDAYRLTHALFGGGTSAPISRELLERGNSVCVLPYDPARDEIILVEQFRIGAYAAGLPPWQLEIVAGVVEDGESDEQVARREMIEECGCPAIDLHYICRGLPSSGVLSEVSSVYCATVDSAAAGGIHGVDGEGEDIRAAAYTYENAMELFAAGTVQHLQSIVALQWLAANRVRLRGE